MTPKELGRELEAARLRAIDDYRRDLTLAWNQARCNALTKSKRGLPPLGQLLADVKDSTSDHGQSPEHMKAAVEMLSQMTGFPMRRAN